MCTHVLLTLQIMVMLAADRNIDQVLAEFKEYATEAMPRPPVHYCLQPWPARLVCLFVRCQRSLRPGARVFILHYCMLHR
jgi:hypothetical protein